MTVNSSGKDWEKNIPERGYCTCTVPEMEGDVSNSRDGKALWTARRPFLSYVKDDMFYTLWKVKAEI